MYSKIIPALIGAAVIALPAGAQSAHRRPVRSRAPARAAKPWSPPGAWRVIYSDATVRVAMDPAQTQRQPDGSYKVRLRWEYPTSQMIDSGHPYRIMVDRKLLDCTTQGIKPISARTYDVHGKPVAGYDTPDSQLRDIDWAKRPPGSSAAKAYAAVCGAVRR